MDQYFYLEGDKQMGPLPANQLKSAGVKRDSLVWKNGLPNWIPASAVPELAPVLRSTPPPVPGTQFQDQVEFMEEQKIQTSRQRNLDRLQAIKDREKERFKVLADRITATGVKARYRLFQFFFWLSVAVVPLWGIAWFAVEQARQNYWDNEWVFPGDQVSGFTRFIMDNHIHPELIHGLAAVIFGVFAVLTFASRMRLLHYAWSGIQDAEASTTPGNAVGLLMIPGYHFVWMFTAYKSLSEDIRSLVLERGYENLEISKPPLAHWFCITRIGLCIPIINLFALIPMFIFNLLFHKNIKDAMVYVLEQKKLQRMEYEKFEG